MKPNLRILVVDDDVDNASSLGELLEIEGHSVLVVHTGEEAIRASTREDFNVSFMDVVLPGLNGVESFIEIRRVRPQARVYMMTGYSVEQLLTQALDGGALGVLEKPFDPEAILRLTTEVGPAGLVIAPPEMSAAGADLGHFIHHTLRANGLRCQHVTTPNHLPAELVKDEILLLDLPTPLMEGMETFKQAQAAGHRAQTVMIPHARSPVANTAPAFADVAVTGVLNKPFDPLVLINKLPQLAA